jgi:hypothetical protein
LIDKSLGNIRKFKGHSDPQHDAQHQEGSLDRGKKDISRGGIGLPRPSGKSGKEISPQDISRRQDDDKDPEGNKQLHRFINSFYEQWIHAANLASFEGTACFSISSGVGCSSLGISTAAVMY